MYRKAFRWEYEGYRSALCSGGGGGGDAEGRGDRGEVGLGGGGPGGHGMGRGGGADSSGSGGLGAGAFGGGSGHPDFGMSGVSVQGLSSFGNAIGREAANAADIQKDNQVVQHLMNQMTMEALAKQEKEKAKAALEFGLNQGKAYDAGPAAQNVSAASVGQAQGKIGQAAVDAGHKEFAILDAKFGTNFEAKSKGLTDNNSIGVSELNALGFDPDSPLSSAQIAALDASMFGTGNLVAQNTVQEALDLTPSIERYQGLNWTDDLSPWGALVNTVKSKGPISPVDVPSNPLNAPVNVGIGLINALGGKFDSGYTSPVNPHAGFGVDPGSYDPDSVVTHGHDPATTLDKIQQGLVDALSAAGLHADPNQELARALSKENTQGFTDKSGQVQKRGGTLWGEAPPEFDSFNTNIDPMGQFSGQSTSPWGELNSLGVPKSLPQSASGSMKEFSGSSAFNPAGTGSNAMNMSGWGVDPGPYDPNNSFSYSQATKDVLGLPWGVNPRGVSTVEDDSYTTPYIDPGLPPGFGSPPVTPFNDPSLAPGWEGPSYSTNPLTADSGPNPHMTRSYDPGIDKAMSLRNFTNPNATRWEKALEVDPGIIRDPFSFEQPGEIGTPQSPPTHYEASNINMLDSGKLLAGLGDPNAAFSGAFSMPDPSGLPGFNVGGIHDPEMGGSGWGGGEPYIESLISPSPTIPAPSPIVPSPIVPSPIAPTPVAPTPSPIGQPPDLGGLSPEWNLPDLSGMTMRDLKDYKGEAGTAERSNYKKYKRLKKLGNKTGSELNKYMKKLSKKDVSSEVRAFLDMNMPSKRKKSVKKKLVKTALPPKAKKSTKSLTLSGREAAQARMSRGIPKVNIDSYLARPDR